MERQLSSYQINLFRYEGKPFESGVTLAVYKPKNEVPEDKLFLVGQATKAVQDNAGEGAVAFQYGTTVYCLSKMPSNLKDSIPVADSYSKEINIWYRNQDHVAHPSNQSDRELLRRLVAKAISNQHIQNKWFVEQYKMVYHWSFRLSEQLSHGKFEVYHGFVFRPYIYEDGTCAVLLDPKFKFVLKETLRDYIASLEQQGKTREEIEYILRGEQVIDHCPVIDCMHRNNPESDCRLKGSGKRRLLTGLDFTRKPTASGHGDLLQYHRNVVCKNNGKIADMMQDSAPIAMIQFPNTPRPYDYPLERLRREVRMHDLDKIGRIKVMEYMRPSMVSRWNMTKSFIQYVDNVPLANLTLRISRDFSQAGERGFPWENFEMLPDVPLAFAKGKEDTDPMRGLEENGPFDLNDERITNVEFTIYCFSRRVTLEQIEEFYNDLTNGFQGRPLFKGFHSLFNVRAPKFDKSMVKYKIELPPPPQKAGSKKFALVIVPAISFKKAKEYMPLKQLFVKNGIPSQFVLSQNIAPDLTPSKYVGILKNLALEIYAKIGGTAWALSRPTGDGKCFIGVDSITRKKVTYFSVQVFNGRGVWICGWTRSVPAEQYGKSLQDTLTNAIRIFAKTQGAIKEVVAHKEGNVWSSETDAIKSATAHHKTRVVSIIKTGIMRVYDKSKQDNITNRGLFVELDKNEALLVTSGPPHPIQGSQKALTVRVASGLDGTTLKDICNDVFLLSTSYGGYILAATSKPVTTYYANKATSISAQNGLEVSDDLWRSTWFI
ncbi:Piwi domain-containing protein [Nitrososphaera viennensis]|uniref:Piwi domain-containing protein n=2 Tax=Nitrososphaera viennensis TaxID=1034015 RepID=A0A060HNJ0_9ARCH|nr:Piwi domain-containing protein [Nitrososphaera viennensis]AIC15131.1 hypothetical protein NVIE_009060 [Nitrososphaera viennensis EN76]UVS70054.1 Piwi domain-containing protein [Nitrososphaera viennensis]